MPFQMSYTDEFGDTYPQSYWKVVQLNFNFLNQAGQIVFQAYANYDSKKTKQRSIGTRAYILDATNIGLFFTGATTNELPLDALVSRAENLALGTRDVNPAQMGPDKSASVSFFATATEV